jgi:GNAT superfamily N-acetyltransferase
MTPATQNTTVEIRMPRSVEEREELYRLRYSVYVEEMGRTVSGADHGGHRIVDPLDDGCEILLGAWVDGQAVGTARVNLVGASDVGALADLYELEPFGATHDGAGAILTRLVVAAEWRGRTVAVRLLQLAVRITLERGARWLHFHCREHLVSLYACLGGVSRYVRADDGPGPLTIMVADLEDLNHFVAVRSPLSRVIRDVLAAREPSQPRVLETASGTRSAA